jgi:hypothetical protein
VNVLIFFISNDIFFLHLSEDSTAHLILYGVTPKSRISIIPKVRFSGSKLVETHNLSIDSSRRADESENAIFFAKARRQTNYGLLKFD